MRGRFIGARCLRCTAFTRSESNGFVAVEALQRALASLSLRALKELNPYLCGLAVCHVRVVGLWGSHFLSG
ncbi:hypothetical protein NDU88_004028 [Pleurodeles waltl]|uniref:Uncharacterized protein n=1 Tax=Pleurodeles waltl TaxID=8319 RepID=A0AAV7SHK7_PLEWA|nr:hypothetical protein NDU88_004028 [Pleurodeles waltl]